MEGILEMLTRIELDGFKTFQNFELELGPFEVIVGANGSGKSNLFDALRLLSRLADAEGELDDAFQGVRGETDQLFSLTAEGEPVDAMRIAVEMLVEPTITDKQGDEVKLEYTRLRYELQVSRQEKGLNSEHIQLLRESLVAIPFGKDAWADSNGLTCENGWLPKKARGGGKHQFITTKQDGGVFVLSLRPDPNGASSAPGGRTIKRTTLSRRSSRAEKATATVLSSVTTTEFPHALAAREEIRHWQFLELNPDDLRGSRFGLRRPNLIRYGTFDLPRRLAQMKNEDANILRDVSSQIAGLVPGIVRIEVEKDPVRPGFILWAKTQDGRSFSWQALSDGTLRLLALVVLRNDPHHAGLLCFEEPENGVHPACLGGLAHLLRDLATDFSQPYDNQPLRQLLVNTHSPVLVSQREIIEVPHSILFAYVVNQVKPHSEAPALRLTRIVPVRSRSELTSKIKTNGNSIQAEFYTLNQVKQYLSSGNFEEALNILETGVNV